MDINLWFYWVKQLSSIFLSIDLLLIHMIWNFGYGYKVTLIMVSSTRKMQTRSNSFNFSMPYCHNQHYRSHLWLCIISTSSCLKVICNFQFVQADLISNQIRYQICCHCIFAHIIRHHICLNFVSKRFWCIQRLFNFNMIRC